MDPLEELYRSDYDRLWRSLYAYTKDPDLASEAIAETFAQAYRRGDELNDRAAWVWRTSFKIANGLLANRSQTSSLPSSPETDHPIELAAATDSPELTTPLTEFLELLVGLSDQQRAILVLRHAGGFPPIEIAKLIGTTPGAVRVQLHRAHKYLRERL